MRGSTWLAALLWVVVGVVPASGGPLADKAEAYATWTPTWHRLGHGAIAETFFTDESLTEVSHFGGRGDSTIWTGTYLGAVALRYMTTGEADALTEALLPTANLSALDDGLGGVHTDHRSNVENTHKRAHPCAVAAAQIDTVLSRTNAGPFGQIRGGRQAPDMNLLAHDEFPEIALRSVINRLYLSQTYSVDRLHDSSSSWKQRAAGVALSSAPAARSQRLLSED